MMHAPDTGQGRRDGSLMVCPHFALQKHTSTENVTLSLCHIVTLSIFQHVRGEDIYKIIILTFHSYFTIQTYDL